MGGAFYQLKERLHGLYDDGEASAIAHAALEHLTGQGRLQRLTRKDEPLDAKGMEQFAAMEEALLKGTPLQYVTGAALFLGRRFAVNSAVLIPRPETEELVQWIAAGEQPRSLIDIGTGSGCIAISLKLALPRASVQALDLSAEALRVAQENARLLQAAVRFEAMDFLDAAARDALPAFEVIVSNPPYIPITERGALHPNVRDHEPAAALFVPGDDALQFYRAIADFGLTHLAAAGSIYCELHRDYADAAATLFNGYGYNEVEVRDDMHGAPRMLRARR
jgi:release factor glutamine methyltransferase